MRHKKEPIIYSSSKPHYSHPPQKEEDALFLKFLDMCTNGEHEAAKVSCKKHPIFKKNCFFSL